MEIIREELPKLIDMTLSMINTIKLSPHLYDGTLWSSHGKKRDRYYLFDRGRRICLKASEIEIARDLAQQEYESELLEKLEKIVDCAENLDILLSESPLESAFKSLSPAKRVLVRTPFPTNAELSKIWLSRPRNILTIKPEELICPALSGKLFRSKSEATIADYLDESNLIYIYECETILDNGLRYFPDFTIYMPATRREIVWEHFGRMDDPDYVKNAVEKINNYELNGYHQGINFYCTFESTKTPLNKATVKNIIERIVRDNT